MSDAETTSTAQAGFNLASLTPVQLAELARALRAFNEPAVAAPTEGREERRKTVTCNWTEMATLTADDGRQTDVWFEAFEVRCHNAHIPKSEWARVLIECPKVSPDVRAFFTRKSSENPDGGYDHIRKEALKAYAPLFPTGLYRWELSHVKGKTRKEVRAQVAELVMLHDRAAADAGMPKLHVWDIIPAVVRAFPDGVREALATHVSGLVDHEDALEELWKKCPEDTTPSPSTALLAGIEPRTQDDPSNPLAAILAALRTKAGKTEKRKATCFRCGSATCNFSKCPAKSETCTKCKKKGHRANVCRGTASSSDRDPVKDANPPFQ